MNDRNILLIIPESFFHRLKKDYESKCKGRNNSRLKAGVKNQREPDLNIDDYIIGSNDMASGLLTEEQISIFKERVYDNDMEKELLEKDKEINEKDKEITEKNSRILQLEGESREFKLKYEELLKRYSRTMRTIEDFYHSATSKSINDIKFSSVSVK